MVAAVSHSGINMVATVTLTAQVMCHHLPFALPPMPTLRKLCGHVKFTTANSGCETVACIYWLFFASGTKDL